MFEKIEQAHLNTYSFLKDDLQWIELRKEILIKGKLFDVKTYTVAPNADIKPEYTYNAHISIQQKIGYKFSFEVTGFYTLFTNAIIKAPYQLNGQDSTNYNGTISQVIARVRM